VVVLVDQVQIQPLTAPMNPKRQQLASHTRNAARATRDALLGGVPS
jgi:hypothetical protein